MPAEPTLPPPAPEAVTHSQQLAEHIANCILAEGDWIPFSRFMDLALYAPGLGYYAAGARKFCWKRRSRLTGQLISLFLTKSD